MDSGEPVWVRCSAVVFRDASVLLVRRDRGGETDWVLPGGTPRRGESTASCVRREVEEETGLAVTVGKVAFVLEAGAPDGGERTLDLVFTASAVDATHPLRTWEPGLTPLFHPVDDLAWLRLRPPIAGHVRALFAARGRALGAPYLGNVWRPMPAGASAARPARPRG